MGTIQYLTISLIYEFSRQYYLGFDEVTRPGVGMILIVQLGVDFMILLHHDTIYI